MKRMSKSFNSKCKIRLSGIDYLNQHYLKSALRRLSQLHDALHYGADNQPVHDTLAHLQAVLNGTAPVVSGTHYIGDVVGEVEHIDISVSSNQPNAWTNPGDSPSPSR
jgi:hypothetical protein